MTIFLEISSPLYDSYSLGRLKMQCLPTIQLGTYHLLAELVAMTVQLQSIIIICVFGPGGEECNHRLNIVL